MTTAEIAFTAYGLILQAILATFFAARRWWPDRATAIGLVAYAAGLAGLPLGAVLAAAGAPRDLVVGPLLMAAWALLGIVVDVWRPRPWRGPPVAWRVMLPYVALYLLAQMWTWWPLWHVARPAWLAFAVLFVVNTPLNLRGHVAPPDHP